MTGARNNKKKIFKLLVQQTSLLWSLVNYVALNKNKAKQEKQHISIPT